MFPLCSLSWISLCFSFSSMGILSGTFWAWKKSQSSRGIFRVSYRGTMCFLCFLWRISLYFSYMIMRISGKFTFENFSSDPPQGSGTQSNVLVECPLIESVMPDLCFFCFIFLPQILFMLSRSWRVISHTFWNWKME